MYSKTTYHGLVHGYPGMTNCTTMINLQYYDILVAHKDY